MMSNRTNDRWAPWRNLRWVFTAIWMLFLAYPIGAVATSDHGHTTKIIGLVLLGAFAVVYLLASVYLLTGRTEVEPRGVWVFVVLLVLAAGLLPIIGENTFGSAPFLMVVAAFSFPTLWAAITVAALIVASIAVPTIAGWEVDGSVVIILVAVGFTMLGFRALAVREGERERAEERQRELNSELAVVAERERVARDVHDILGHSLTVITIKTELAGRLIDLDPQRAKDEMAEVNALARSALAEVRATVGALRTPDLPSVIASAQSAFRAADIAATLPDPRTATPHGELFAWVLREAVTNVVRHSHAMHCEVRIDDATLTVHDDGCGLGAAVPGNGLRGLIERVESAGGTLTIESDTGGTTLTAVVDDE
ncbi:histidine kinase [Gordonia sp. L191]|uniref:sensor histidine kinase n=1 Tax=Gordonia sp. L191 TaxID=2982699 RepID=UPI0024BF52F4|nr:histidine kinase [Gordonia sp. L191]WHU45614.1 histidine kinase [Gordonia sp. L191]